MAWGPDWEGHMLDTKSKHHCTWVPFGSGMLATSHVLGFSRGALKMVLAMGVHMGPKMPEIYSMWANMVARIVLQQLRADIVTTDWSGRDASFGIQGRVKFGKVSTSHVGSCVGGKGGGVGNWMSTMGEEIWICVMDALSSVSDSLSARTNLSSSLNDMMASLTWSAWVSSMGVVTWGNDNPHDCPLVSFGRWVWSSAACFNAMSKSCWLHEVALSSQCVPSGCAKMMMSLVASLQGPLHMMAPYRMGKEEGIVSWTYSFIWSTMRSNWGIWANGFPDMEGFGCLDLLYEHNIVNDAWYLDVFKAFNRDIVGGSVQENVKGCIIGGNNCSLELEISISILVQWHSNLLCIWCWLGCQWVCYHWLYWGILWW